MGTPQDQGVDPLLVQRHKIPPRGPQQLVARGVARLDVLDEDRAGRREELDVGAGLDDRSIVGAARDGRLGADQADPIVARGMHGGPNPRVDHPDDRDAVGVRHVGDRRHLDRVAGDHQHLDVAFGQVPRDLERERADLLERPRAVGEPAVVAEVQDRFVRQQVEDGAGDGEPADAGVEDADRPLIAHPTVRTRRALTPSPSHRRYHHRVSETFFSARSSSGAHAWVDRYFHPPSASRHTTSP